MLSGRGASGHAFLLDTSTLIWAVAEPSRLSSAARRAITAGPRVLSVASYWEVVIKSRKGLLAIADPIHWWERASQAMSAEILSIRTDHIATLANLPDHHRDPFDRILIAQAIAEGFTFISGDVEVARYPAKVLW